MTGWSVDEQGDRVARALQDSGARALLHFAAPPAAARAPIRLINPRWAQPFEIFSRALGMPSSNEADPSALLAVAVPLMFGYMFGDMGQGSADRGRGLVAARELPHRTAADGGGLGAGFAVARVGSAAVGALAEKPELFGRLLIFIGLAEGIAIYGLIVSILMLNLLG